MFIRNPYQGNKLALSLVTFLIIAKGNIIVSEWSTVAERLRNDPLQPV
jgi:hypothetical protein